jgi:C4-dicarboxylate-specific signal transduction histidine kinase
MGRLMAVCFPLNTSPNTSYNELSALLHELNQPLAAIQSNAQAAQRILANTTLDRVELRGILEDIVTDNMRAAGIVKRLGQVIKDNVMKSGNLQEEAR